MKKLFIFLTLLTFTSGLNIAYATTEDSKENTILADESEVVIEASDINDKDTVYDSDPANHKEDNRDN